MPTRKIFLDTSYLLKLELANDQNHQAAQAHWQQVITTSPAWFSKGAKIVYLSSVTMINEGKKPDHCTGELT
ncbi:hypothetical protein [Nostoc sp. LPT]|uniref:hypothetical protein n=1 Tax=Nostoc sp. LPT TaxID=2815387 RepID=UPI0025D1BE22|nr:hypothetical protein [Nostoc sp. LPT]